VGSQREERLMKWELEGKKDIEGETKERDILNGEHESKRDIL